MALEAEKQQQRWQSQHGAWSSFPENANPVVHYCFIHPSIFVNMDVNAPVNIYLCQQLFLANGKGREFALISGRPNHYSAMLFFTAYRFYGDRKSAFHTVVLGGMSNVSGISSTFPTCDITKLLTWCSPIK